MVTGFPNDEATIQAAIMGDGPVEAAFTVYSDFETYGAPNYFVFVCDFFFWGGGHNVLSRKTYFRQLRDFETSLIKWERLFSCRVGNLSAHVGSIRGRARHPHRRLGC